METTEIIETSVPAVKRTDRERVYEYYRQAGYDGATDVQVAAGLGIPVDSIRRIRRELGATVESHALRLRFNPGTKRIARVFRAAL